MSQDLDNIINTLWDQIRGIKKGDDCDLCEIYLRSTCQKHLFAEERLKSLTKEIERFIQTVRDKQELSSFNIEMDFDHCVLSLRSSLEHLAQLINAIIPLNLSPKFTRDETLVTLSNVTDEIKNNDLSKNNKCLCNLSSYLKLEMEKDWYKELHDLRITMFHDKFDRLPRTSLPIPRYAPDLKFLLPSGTAKSLVTKEEREITSYCGSVIRKVEGVLKYSFDVLSKYLSN
jgi:bacterioferritin (cytochrome b1)